MPLKEIVKRSIKEWKEWMINDFEESVFPQFPSIREIKEELYEQGAIYAAMTGSGSSVFGLFEPNAILPSNTFEEKTFIYRGILK